MARKENKRKLKKKYGKSWVTAHKTHMKPSHRMGHRFYDALDEQSKKLFERLLDEKDRKNRQKKHHGKQKDQDDVTRPRHS